MQYMVRVVEMIQVTPRWSLTAERHESIIRDKDERYHEPSF